MCGSFFYGLLLHVKSNGASPREHKKGIKDRVSGKDIFWGLSSFIDADAPFPASDFCSDYLKGDLPKSTVFFKIDDDYLIASFDRRVRKQYGNELKRIHDNVVSCLKDSDEARIWLAQALLRIIHDDSSLEGAQFYCREDGTPISRDDLLEHETQRPWDVRPGVLNPWTVVTDVYNYDKTGSRNSDTAAESEEHADAEYVEAEIVDEDPRKKEEKSGTTQNISIVNNGSGIAAWNIGELTVNMGDKK